jgi:hypothetical protein
VGVGEGTAAGTVAVWGLTMRGDGVERAMGTWLLRQQRRLGGLGSITISDGDAEC